jgi:hypothetical protein
MSDPKEDRIRVDLSLKDTEYGWMRRWDAFFIAAAPAWFNVLGWIALLAGLQFVNAKRHHWLIQVVIALSLALMWQYFIAAFCRIEFVLPPRLRRVQVAFSIIIAFVLAYICYRAAQFAVFLIADMTPNT